MPIDHILILSLLQGLTEFLPISSSAHLVLLPKLVDWEDQGLAFDVAVHLGSLVAVVFYFRRDLWRIAHASWVWLFARARLDESGLRDARLGRFIALATVPICVAGPLLHDFVSTVSRSYAVIAATTILYGVLLGVADRWGRGGRSERELRWTDALWIGVAQALAPIPGTSRSGITVTAGLFRGLSRSASARFSFLISVPTIVLVGGYQTVSLLRSEEAVDWTALGVGALVSCVAAYTCIRVFLALLERIGLMPFVVYRLALGAVLVAVCLWPAASDPSPAAPEPLNAAAATTQGATTATGAALPAAQLLRSSSGVSRTSYPGATRPSRE